VPVASWPQRGSAAFADLELAVISDRIREAWHAIREAGKWPGGTVPFGRIPVKAEPNGWRLALDPEYAPVVTEMVRRHLAGHSFHMLAAGSPACQTAHDRAHETASPATVLAHKGATALDALNQTFLHQDVYRLAHRAPRHLVLLHQGCLRGDDAPGGQSARLDLGAQDVSELTPERHRSLHQQSVVEREFATARQRSFPRLLGSGVRGRAGMASSRPNKASHIC
jgi:hypothetical protein